MMVSKMMLLAFLLGFVSCISAYLVVKPETKSITTGQKKTVAPPSPLASVPQYVRPASVNLMPRNSLFNRYIVQWPQRTFNYGTLGQRAQGRGYFNNLRMLLRGYGNERSVVSSILGTNPYRGYYPGQMVRSSLISPGGGMFVSADGTDGSIMNADGSVTTVDGSDVSIDSGF